MEMTGWHNNLKSLWKYILISALHFSAGSLLLLEGQTQIISNDHDLFIFMQSDPDYINNQRERYSRIEGSPYLNKEFVSGSALYNRKKYLKLDMRYNAYEGYFEFRVEDGFKYFDPRITRLDTVWVGDVTFVFVNYLVGNNIKQSYMELVNHGNTKVYLLRRIHLNEAVPAQGYAEAKPATFEKMPENIFVELPGRPATQFKGKSSVKEIFPDHAATLSVYAKKNKLKLRNRSGIVELCIYYDTLDQ